MSPCPAGWPRWPRGGWARGPEIGESVGSRLEHNDGNRERDNVLLKGEVSIYCYESSNCADARTSNSPFLSVVHPIWRAVFTSWKMSVSCREDYTHTHVGYRWSIGALFATQYFVW